jgi:hypothetical protein
MAMLNNQRVLFYSVFCTEKNEAINAVAISYWVDHPTATATE